MNEIVRARLYGGKYLIEFNPRAHRYKVGKADGQEVNWIEAIPDGVTSICGAVIPKYLDNWAGRVDVDFVRKGYLRHVETEGIPPEQSAFLALCEEAETEHQRIRDSAGKRGSDVHDAIEKKLTGKPFEVPTDPMALAGWEAFCKWERLEMCEIIDSERLIYHDDLFYCGKTDIWGIVDGKPSILDFKTGSGFYEDQPYQLTGYAMAIERETGAQIDDGYIIHLDKKTSNYKVYHVELNAGLKDAWFNAVCHYKHFKKVSKLVKEMKDGFSKRAA